MFEIDRIPSVVWDALQQKDICEDDVLLTARADRTCDHTVADVYLLATSDRLVILSGITALENRAKSKRRTPNVHSVFKTLDYRTYPLDSLKDIRVEELLSAGRLTAKQTTDREEHPVLLAAFTNFCKDSMLIFAKYANKLALGETPEIDPKDDPKDKHCPKCGMRYPDPNRKICPHCMEKGKLFRRFSTFLLRYRVSLILTVLSLVLLTAMSILAPYLSSGFFYDEVIDSAGSFAGQIFLVVFLIVATNLLKMGATMINNLVTSVIAAKVVFDLKKTIFSAIERLSLSFFTGRQTGGLMLGVSL